VLRFDFATAMFRNYTVCAPEFWMLMRTCDEHFKFLRCSINGNPSIEIASANRTVDEHKKGGARFKRRPFAKLA